MYPNERRFVQKTEPDLDVARATRPQPPERMATPSDPNRVTVGEWRVGAEMPEWARKSDPWHYLFWAGLLIVALTFVATGHALEESHSVDPWISVSFVVSLIATSLGYATEGKRMRKIAARVSEQINDGGSGGFPVKISIKDDHVTYGKDLGCVKFVDDQLYFEGFRTSFSFSNSVTAASSLKMELRTRSRGLTNAKAPQVIRFSNGTRSYRLTIELIDARAPNREFELLQAEINRWSSIRTRAGTVNVLPPLALQ